MSHWHEELEIVYIIHGNNLHYIDGQCIEAEPGRLIVTNTEVIHNIIEREPAPDGTPVAIMLILSKKFLEREFPQFHSFYFLNNK